MAKSYVKALALALSVATVMSLTVGCSKSKTNTNSTTADSNITTKNGFFWSKNPIHVSMLFSDNTAYPYKDSWTFFKDLAAKTNVTVDLTIVGMADYNTKRSTLIASGQEPEVIPKTYPGQEDNYVASGQILPISDYLNLMPNFTKEVKDWKLEDDLKSIKQGDGKYYIMPGLHEIYVQDYSICMRTDILQKNNIKVPETWDEFYDALKKLKAAYPNITPFSDRWQLGATLQIAGNGFIGTPTGLKGQDADWSPSNLLSYDSKKNSFSFFPTSDGYKAELQFFNKLVSEGLLDKESATQTSDTAMNKFGSGQSFAIATNSQEMLQHLTPRLDSALGKGNYSIAKINFPAGPAGKLIQGNRLENGVIVSKKAKDDPNFKTIMGFVDWLWNSYAGQEYCKWGTSDMFTKTDDTYKLNAGYKSAALGLNTSDTTAKDIRTDLGFGSGVFILTNGGPKALAQSYMSSADITWSDNVNKTRTLVAVPPKIAYDEDTNDAQNMLNTTLKDYYDQMTYKFILGQQNFTTDWDNYVKSFQSKGSDKYTKTANDAYAKQKK